MTKPRDSIAPASAAHHGQGAPSHRRTPTEASAGEGRSEPWSSEAAPGSEGAEGEPRQRGEGAELPGAGPGAEPPISNKRAAKRLPSNLDTPGITRGDLHDRMSWLRDVEGRTDKHRTEKAQLYWRRGREVFEEVLSTGGTREQAVAARRYYLGRSLGQIRRFEQVLSCGTEKVWVVCLECGRAKEQERRCRTQRLCLRCRLDEGAMRRVQFERARRRALQRVADRGLLNPRRDDRWSEKLVTLTLPHKATDSVAGRVMLLFAAWSLFRSSLREWARGKGALRSLIAWLRVFEWVTGKDDGLGHPIFISGF